MAGDTPSPSLLEMTTDAIRYWEPRRLIYNAALALVVAGYFIAFLPLSRAAIRVDNLLLLFLCAVVANLLYCAVYIADLFAQSSAFRHAWLRQRWILLVTGIAFGAILARFVSLAAFSISLPA